MNWPVSTNISNSKHVAASHPAEFTSVWRGRGVSEKHGGAAYKGGGNRPDPHRGQTHLVQRPGKSNQSPYTFY